MILQGESGLSAADYNNLLTATVSPALTVTMSQYSPIFASHDTDGIAAQDEFDAIVCNDVLVRVYQNGANTITVDTLASEDGSDQFWSSQNLTATAVASDVSPSLAVSGDTVRCFWYDDTNIKYFESTDKGATWGAAQTVGAANGLSFLAATATTRVHYTTLTSSDNQRLNVYEDDGGWSATNSEVYWPFTPQSFDAVAGNQVDDGAAATNDVIVMATDLPPIITLATHGTEVYQKLEQVQGIAIFRYQNGRWSDHVTFDVVDRAPAYPARYGVRISSSGEWLFMVYERYDGSSATYGHYATAVTRSKDGFSWELPYLLTRNVNDPAILLKRGDHCYLLNSYRTYRSASCGYVGDDQVTQSLTSRVTTFDTEQGDISECALTVANPEGTLDATTPYSLSCVKQIKVELGYTISGSPVAVQTFLGDVDAMGESENLPAKHIQVRSRDLLARMMTFKADQPNEWNSQQIGGDNFTSAADGTDYSGMRHTATQDGHFKTPSASSTLALVSDQSTGLAFCTHLTDAFNGVIQSGVKVHSSDHDDWIGLIFRAYDKKNHYRVIYDTSDDTIKLYDVKDNDDTMLEQSSTMGWSSGTWYYLRARFRYSYVWVYYSTDGATWSQAFALEVDGMASGTAYTWANFTGRSIPNLTGRVGYVGYGYSEESDSYPAVPVGPIVAPSAPSYGKGRIMGGQSGVVYCADITSPSWVAANAGLAPGFYRCWRLFQDPFHWSEGDRTLWGLFGDSVDGPHCLRRMEDFPNGNWDLIYGGVSPHGPRDIAISENTEGLLYLLWFQFTWGTSGGENWILKSTNNGTSWTVLRNGSDFGEMAAKDVWPGMHNSLAMSYDDDDVQCFCSRGLHSTKLDFTYTQDGWSTYSRYIRIPNFGDKLFYPQTATGHIIWGTSETGDFYRHSNYGIDRAQWVTISDTALSNYEMVAISVHPSDHELMAILYDREVDFAGPYIRLSTDYGASWSTWWSNADDGIVSRAMLLAWGEGNQPVNCTMYDAEHNQVWYVSGPGTGYTDVTANLHSVVSGWSATRCMLPYEKRIREAWLNYG